MRRAPLVVLLALGAGVVAFYIEGLPWVSDIPGWFYRFRDKQIDTRMLAGVGIFVATLCGVLAVQAAGRGRRDRRALVLLVLASWALQLGVSAVGGPVEILRRHEAGHGEYFRVTAERRGKWAETLLEFEKLAEARELGAFPPSKPPGVFLLYMGVDALARVSPVAAAVEPVAEEARARPALAPYAATAALSIFLLPLLTALAIPVVVVLGRTLFEDEAAAWGGGVLWATAPATLLIQYHLDGALYPLLAVLACAAAAIAVRRDRLAWAAAAGVLLVFGLYVSFSLLVAIPLALGCMLAATIARARSGAGWAALRRAGMHLFVLLVAASATFLVLRFALRFDLLVRYENAMAYHEHWKRAIPHEIWRAAALVEYALYVGVPLVAVWLWRVVRGAFSMIRRRAAVADLAAVGLLAVLLATSWVSGTNEVSRMWMLVNPFVALSAATGLRALARRERAGNGWQRPLLWIAATQVVVAITMKGFQEW